MMVGTDGQLWEHAHPDTFTECAAPDNGTAGWFVELFRFMLLMEDNGALWITKGTPRAWLEQGKEIFVENAPTFWGDLWYKIASDVASGEIRAEIKTPSRKATPAIKLRLRHPTSAKIVSATVNGQEIQPDADGETITVASPEGTLEIVAKY